MSDTRPLPASELRSAEDARYKRLQSVLHDHLQKVFDICPESCWCWEVEAVLSEHEAALAASPVTLEETLYRSILEECAVWRGLVEQAGSAELLRGSWSTPDGKLWVRAYAEALEKYPNNARRLAGEGGVVKESLTTRHDTTTSAPGQKGDTK